MSKPLTKPSALASLSRPTRLKLTQPTRLGIGFYKTLPPEDESDLMGAKVLIGSVQVRRSAVLPKRQLRKPSSGHIYLALGADRLQAAIGARVLEMLSGEKVDRPLIVRTELENALPTGLQSLINATAPRRPAEEALRRTAVDRILTCSEWLSTQQVGLRANPNTTNPHTAPGRWIKEGKLFAIDHAEGRLFPAYAFDESGRPLKAMQEIIGILVGYTPMRLASWFESTSSTLDGHRPRELLATEPDRVIEAARSRVAGPVHG